MFKTSCIREIIMISAVIFSSVSTHAYNLLSFDLYFSQWSDAMLSNLLYCQGRVTGPGATSDLEAEWKKLYPASLLTARLQTMLSNTNKQQDGLYPIFSEMNAR